MTAFFDPLSGLALGEQAMLLLAATVAGLVLLSLGFAAYTLLLRLHRDFRERRWRRLCARWEEPVLAALADRMEIERVHEHVADDDRLPFVRFVLEYARRVRGEEREILQEIAQPYLPPIAARVQSRHSEIRVRAVQTLGTLGLPAFSADVLTALDDESPLVAMVAARSLCQPEHPEFAPAVLRRLARFEGWSRRFLSSMLAGVGPEAAPPLRDALGREDEVPWVRAVAANALRILADFDAGDLAARVVSSTDDRELTAAGLRLLTAVGRPDHVEVIRSLCASPDFVIRSQALHALSVVGDHEDSARLLGALSDPSPWVAIRAAQGLRAAGATDVLTKVSESDHPRAALARQVLVEEAES